MRVNLIDARHMSDAEVMNAVMGIAGEILELLSKGGQVFLCGNGGSAADARHIATEFISRFYRERPAMNAEALTVNTSTLTAIGNDYSYERVFARQLEGKGRAGDIPTWIEEIMNQKALDTEER